RAERDGYTGHTNGEEPDQRSDDDAERAVHEVGLVRRAFQAAEDLAEPLDIPGGADERDGVAACELEVGLDGHLGAAPDDAPEKDAARGIGVEVRDDLPGDLGARDDDVDGI